MNLLSTFKMATFFFKSVLAIVFCLVGGSSAKITMPNTIFEFTGLVNRGSP